MFMISVPRERVPDLSNSGHKCSSELRVSPADFANFSNELLPTKPEATTEPTGEKPA